MLRLGVERAPVLKIEQAFINAAAEDCSKSDKFSEAIRKNRIGFSEKTP